MRRRAHSRMSSSAACNGGRASAVWCSKVVTAVTLLPEVSCRELVARKAADRVHLEGEHAGLYRRVVAQQRVGLFGGGVEQVDPAALAAVEHGTHDGEHAVGPQTEVPPTV